jgi:hypothetical protein
MLSKSEGQWCQLMEAKMAVHLEHDRKDKTFAVYIGGNDDVEGDRDRLFTYDGRAVTENQARGAALDYGQKLGLKFGGLIEHR